MSETVINQWSALCIEENIMVDIWSPDLPTICPNAIAHTSRALDPTRIIFVKEIRNNQVEVMDGTPGNYQNTTRTLSIPAGDPGSVSTHDISWKSNIKIWTTEFFPQAAHMGDVIGVVIDPDRLVGILVSDHSIGDTILSVSQTVFTYPYLTCGLEVSLNDGVHTQNLGQIISIDYTNYRITVENALTYAFGTNTGVLINLVSFKNKKISRSNYPYTFGSKGFATKSIPANIVMRFVYTNSSGLAKDVDIDFEYNVY